MKFSKTTPVATFIFLLIALVFSGYGVASEIKDECKALSKVRLKATEVELARLDELVDLADGLGDRSALLACTNTRKGFYRAMANRLFSEAQQSCGQIAPAIKRGDLAKAQTLTDAYIQSRDKAVEALHDTVDPARMFGIEYASCERRVVQLATALKAEQEAAKEIKVIQAESAKAQQSCSNLDGLDDAGLSARKSKINAFLGTMDKQYGQTQSAPIGRAYQSERASLGGCKKQILGIINSREAKKRKAEKERSLLVERVNGDLVDIKASCDLLNENVKQKLISKKDAKTKVEQIDAQFQTLQQSNLALLKEDVLKESLQGLASCLVSMGEKFGVDVSAELQGLGEEGDSEITETQNTELDVEQPEAEVAEVADETVAVTDEGSAE